MDAEGRGQEIREAKEELTMPNDGIIPITVKYRSSLQKWHGIKKFAEVNKLGGIDKIDAMIKRIEEKGDAILSNEYTLEIRIIEEYMDVMYSDESTPCSHCLTYRNCRVCPLWGGKGCTCCVAWVNATRSAREAIDKRCSDSLEE